MPSYTGETVHFGPPYTCASVRSPVHYVIGRSAALGQRQIETLEFHLDPQQVAVEHPHRLIEQLLTGLVAFEDDDRNRHQRDDSQAAPAPGRTEVFESPSRGSQG